LTNDTIYAPNLTDLAVIDIINIKTIRKVNLFGFSQDACLSKDENFLFVTTRGGDIEILDILIGFEKRLFYANNYTSFSQLIAGESGIIFSFDSQNVLIKWDLVTGKRVWSSKKSVDVNCLFYDEHNKKILGGSGDGSIVVWDYESGKRIYISNIHNGPINSIAKVNSTTIATGSDDRTVKLLNTNTFDCEKILYQPSEVYSVAVTTDGMHLLSGLKNKSFLVMNIDRVTIDRVTVVYSIDNFNASVRKVAVSPDGRFVAIKIGYTLKLFKLSIPL
jgi:WD40 repeat protein